MPLREFITILTVATFVANGAQYNILFILMIIDNIIVSYNKTKSLINLWKKSNPVLLVLATLVYHYLSL